MTQLAKLLLGDYTMSGYLTGSGSLVIPAGLTVVTLTGTGGVGGSGSWYDPGQPGIDPVAGQDAIEAVAGQDAIEAVAGQPYIAYDPGQPYIAPSDYHAAVSATPASGSFTQSGGPTPTGGVYTDSDWATFSGWIKTSTEETRPIIPGGWSLSTTVGTEGSSTWASPTSPHTEYRVWWTLSSYTPPTDAVGAYYGNPGQPGIDPVAGQDAIEAVAGQDAIAAVAGQEYIAAVAGQEYIAPSSGVGTYVGTATTASLNGASTYWAGGMGAVAGDPSVQTLTSTGTGQTLTYSIGSGGSLSYSCY